MGTDSTGVPAAMGCRTWQHVQHGCQVQDTHHACGPLSTVDVNAGQQTMMHSYSMLAG